MDESGYSREIDFLKDGPWDELYAITQHWKSDLEFYRDDLRFLHHLSDRYLIWITRTENLESVREPNQSLEKLIGEALDLIEKVKKHLFNLGVMVENNKEANAGLVVREHEHLEAEVAGFVKSFRENRKRAFEFTGYIIDSEKLANFFNR